MLLKCSRVVWRVPYLDKHPATHCTDAVAKDAEAFWLAVALSGITPVMKLVQYL